MLVACASLGLRSPVIAWADDLLEALVVPVLLYNCGGWPLLCDRAYRRLDSTLVRWQRRIAREGFWRESRMTDEAFRARFLLPSLSVRLMKHRIMLAFQMSQSAPQTLFELLSADDESNAESWLEALRHGLRWFIFESGDEHPLHGKELSSSAIFAWLATTSWTDVLHLRRLIRRVLLQEQTIHEVAEDHKKIIELCEAAGVQLSEAVASSTVEPSQRFPCSSCSRSFGSIQALSSHMWKAHGLRSKERRFMTSTTCLACNRCFWTSARLQQHLRRSQQWPNGCFALLQKYMDPVAPDTTCGFSEIPDNLQAAAYLPSQPSFGPSATWTTTTWARRRESRLQQLNVDWAAEGFPATLPDAVRSRVAACLSKVTRVWLRDQGGVEPDDCSLAYLWLEPTELSDDPQHGQWAFLLWGQNTLYDVLDSVTDDVDALQYVEDQFLTTAADLPMWRFICLQCYNRQAHFLTPFTSRRVIDLPPQPCVPVWFDAVGGKHLFILHAFSGRRRPGDCHDWLKELAAELLPDYEVRLIALDTAIHATHCDLFGEGFTRALRLSSLSLFAAMLAGPPCETWTAARHLACDRPHRVRGRGSLMEHPAIPVPESYASTWRTEIQLNVMNRLFAGRMLNFGQFRYGASSVKPTVFHVLGMPAFARVFYGEADQDCPRPQSVLSGYNIFTRQFLTASAKEYPSALC
eukprot:Skav206263  [mRNA]  locus=scaffold265:182632:185264:+ [translate_table: standard]